MHPQNTDQYYERLGNICDEAAPAVPQAHQFKGSACLKSAAYARPKFSPTTEDMASESYLPPRAQDTESAKLIGPETYINGAGTRPNSSTPHQREQGPAVVEGKTDVAAVDESKDPGKPTESAYSDLQPKLVRRPYNYKRRPGSSASGSSKLCSANPTHNTQPRGHKSHSSRRQQIGAAGIPRDGRDRSRGTTPSRSPQWIQPLSRPHVGSPRYSHHHWMESSPGVYPYPNVSRTPLSVSVGQPPLMYTTRQVEPYYGQDDYGFHANASGVPGSGVPGSGMPISEYGDYGVPTMLPFEHSTPALASEASVFNGMQMMYPSHAAAASPTESLAAPYSSAANKYTYAGHHYHAPESRSVYQSSILHDSWTSEVPKKATSNILTPTSLCGSPTEEPDPEKKMHGKIQGIDTSQSSLSGSDRDTLQEEGHATDSADALHFDFSAYGLSEQQAASFKRIFERQLEMLYRAVAHEFNKEHKSTQIGIELVLSYLQKIEIKDSN